MLASCIGLVFTHCDKDTIQERHLDNWGDYIHDGSIKLSGVYLDEQLWENGGVQYFMFFENGLAFRSPIFKRNTDSIGPSLQNNGYFNDRLRDEYELWAVFDIKDQEMAFKYPQAQKPKWKDRQISRYRIFIESPETIIITGHSKKPEGTWIEWSGYSLKFQPLITKPDSNCIIVEELGWP